VQSIACDAIVVRAIDYGEADRVATLITRSHGKVSALARGARRSRKRFAALELFAAGEARLRERGGELWSLDGFEVRRGYPHLAGDVARLAHGAYVCELARELVPPHHAEPRVFELLAAMLALLDGTPPGAAHHVAQLRSFELSLLEALGLAPSLDRCLECGRALDEESAAGASLEPSRGGLLCASCGDGHGGRALGDGAWAALVEARRLQLGDPPTERPPSAWAGARDALQLLLRAHLGKSLRTLEFIAKVNAF